MLGFGKKTPEPEAAGSPRNIARVVAEIKRLEAELAAKERDLQQLELKVVRIFEPGQLSVAPWHNVDKILARVAEAVAAYQKGDTKIVSDLEHELTGAREARDRAEQGYKFDTSLRWRLLSMIPAGDRALIRFSGEDLIAVLKEVEADVTRTDTPK